MTNYFGITISMMYSIAEKKLKAEGVDDKRIVNNLVDFARMYNFDIKDSDIQFEDTGRYKQYFLGYCDGNPIYVKPNNKIVNTSII